MQKIKKAMFLTSLALLATLGSTGCFSTLVWQGSENDDARQARVELTDSILAIGQPDAASLAKIGNPQALFFLGENHSYFLEEGGADLRRIAKELDGQYIGMGNEYRALWLKDGKLWGDLPLVYRHFGQGAYGPEECAKLAALGFVPQKDNESAYVRVVHVKGALCPKVELAENQLQAFKVRRSISFYAPPKSAVIPVIKRVAFMPVAVAADVVTSPLQLLGVGAVIIILSNSRLY